MGWKGCVRMNDDQEPDERGVYRIEVKGVLGKEWSDWFDGLAITPQASGETLFTGLVADQAALHGLLCKIRDLGLPLLSVNRVQSKAYHEPREPERGTE